MTGKTNVADLQWPWPAERIATSNEEHIRAFYESSKKLETEIGIDQKQAFWAHVTMYSIPSFPDSLEATLQCEGCK
jgi:hypothetical protein